MRYVPISRILSEDESTAIAKMLSEKALPLRSKMREDDNELKPYFCSENSLLCHTIC